MHFLHLDVIDLTGEDKDDLQRAIALSLAESDRAYRETGITDEEQAISRWAPFHHNIRSNIPTLATLGILKRF